jgi:hypothetical protein
MTAEVAGLSRQEFAQRVGLSVAEIRRKESVGLLSPAGRTRYNRPYYGEREVAIVLEMSRADGREKDRRQIERSSDFEYNRQDACRVFEMLQEGKPLDQIVTALGLHPHMVRASAADFAAMNHSFVIRGHVMEQINKLPLDGVFPIETDMELLEILKVVSYGTCTLCQKKPRSICRHCAGIPAASAHSG